MLKYELVKNSLSLYNTVVAQKRYHKAEYEREPLSAFP